MCSYNIPLVADIHFAPSVALRVAECFDKIRVNPGNFGTQFTIQLFSFLIIFQLFSFLIIFEGSDCRLIEVFYCSG